MGTGKFRPREKSIFAPMAGYSFPAYRELCMEMGAGMCFTEMVSAKALSMGGKKTLGLLETAKNEKPIGVQLFGYNPRDFAKATEILESMNRQFDAIDINAGCSVPKVYRQGAGAALLKDPARIGKIIQAIAGKTNRPITLKTRIGVDAKKINVLETARIAQDSGCHAITIHARTASQGFSGKADWKWIARARQEAAEIKVIGNGDIFCAQDAKRMLEETKCDYAMIGRSALGNAAIFAECKNLIEGKKLHVLGKGEEFREFCKIEEKNKVETNRFRAIALQYCRAMPNAAKARNKIALAKTKKEIIAAVSALG